MLGSTREDVVAFLCALLEQHIRRVARLAVLFAAVEAHELSTQQADGELQLHGVGGELIDVRCRPVARLLVVRADARLGRDEGWGEGEGWARVAWQGGLSPPSPPVDDARGARDGGDAPPSQPTRASLRIRRAAGSSAPDACGAAHGPGRGDGRGRGRVGVGVVDKLA